MANLPAQFSDLEPFSKWLISSEIDRTQQIESRPEKDLRDFYDAVFPRMNEMITYLNTFPLDNMPASETSLFNLAKMMMEVATIIEHGRSIIGQYFDVARFVPLDETKG